MANFLRIKFFCLFILQMGCASRSQAIDLVAFEKALTSEEGVLGEVHGADSTGSLWVFVFRDSKNFFDFEHFSLIPKDALIAKTLGELSRHDKIRIKGSFMPNRSKQKHIEITSILEVQKYENPRKPGSYKYEADFPKDLVGKTKAEFLVHAVLHEGHVVVLEYKDKIVPLRIKPDQAVWVKDLYRNDLISVEYLIAGEPSSPTHLKLNSDVATPVQVIEKMLPKHLKPADVTGELVLFPKSPQVIFDVYAVLENLPSGNKRQYTLVNFENKELFAALRKKCDEAWAKAPQDFENGRNKLVHRKIKVRAKGKFNVVDPNQANVQILIDKIEDLEILGL